MMLERTRYTAMMSLMRSPASDCALEPIGNRSGWQVLTRRRYARLILPVLACFLGYSQCLVVRSYHAARCFRYSPLIDGARDKKRIFQIAYTEGLLITRAELLKAHGYDVVSVLSNEAAKRLLDKSHRYDLFIVGHAAPRETREAMFQWFRAAFPKSKILALTSPYEGQLSGADYSVPLSDPEAWLGAVVSAASSNDTRTSRQSG